MFREFNAQQQASRDAYNADRSVEEGFCGECHVVEKATYMRWCLGCRGRLKAEKANRK